MSRTGGDRILTMAIPQFDGTIPTGRQELMKIPLLTPVDAVNLIFVLLQANQRFFDGL